MRNISAFPIVTKTIFKGWDKWFHIIPQASRESSLFITGLSMECFGAMRLGAKYGHLFKGFSGLSSITHIDQMKQFIEENLSKLRQENKKDESVLQTILAHPNKLPPFRFDCGLSGNLLSENRKLHQTLEKHSIPHIYEEFLGEHNWEYWEEHIFDTLLFFNKQLNI